MPKVRCSVCRQYVDRDSVYRGGVSKFCSESCWLERASRRPIQRSQPRPRRVVSGSATAGVSKATYGAVIERDQGRCRWCGSTSVQQHHVVYRSQDRSRIDDPTNLICLCVSHHAEVHSDVRRWRPVLQSCIGLTYAGRLLTVPEVERWMTATATAPKQP